MREYAAVVATVLAGMAAAQPDAARVEWLRAHAAPFVSDEAGRGFDDLQPLKAWIGDARIVSLGEPTHGTRECFQFKHRLTEFLASEMGFTIFAIEASSPEADLLTAYVLGGEGDPRRLIAGMYFWTWDTEEVLAMVEWMRAFNAQAKAEGSARRITFTGFDMQTEVVAAERVRSLLREAAPDDLPRLDRVLATMKAAEMSSPQTAAGVLIASFPADAARGKKITFSGSIRTTGVTGHAGLWMRADGPKGPLAFSNMQDLGIAGDTPWTRREFTLDIPAETTGVVFGMLVVGEGEAWFDNLAVDVGTSTFRDPEQFDLDFEAGELGGFMLSTPGVIARNTDQEPVSGRRCVHMRVSPPPAAVGERATPREAFDAANELAADLAKREVELAARVGARAAAWGVQNARILAQCAASRAIMAGDRAIDVDLWNRDASMAANVAWLLGQHPGEKIVLWAHNGHVGRGEMAMGHYLERRFPGEMVVVGFATGEGEYQAIGGGGLRSHPLKAPPPGSVEWHLDAVGHARAVFDLRGAKADDAASGWLRRPAPFRLIGALAMPREQFFPRAVADEFDLLVWQKATTRARPLGGTIRGE